MDNPLGLRLHVEPSPDWTWRSGLPRGSAHLRVCTQAFSSIRALGDRMDGVTGYARGGPALGEFLTALQDRWRSLSREDLVALLGEHAERLPVRERQAFLDIFPDLAAGPMAPGRSAGVGLPGRIEAFAARVAAGEFADDEEYRWDTFGPSDEEYAPWVADAEALFAEIGEVFVAGDLVAARAAYELLLAPFGLTDDDGWSLELWRLEVTDVPETLARYVRCVYETTPANQRPQAVHRAFVQVPGGWALTLADVSTSRVGGLPDLDVFLPGWIDALLAESGFPSARDRVRLLVEAATLGGGVNMLADVARRPGPHQGGVALAWIDALTELGRHVEARAAAAEALDLPGADGVHRAEAADRLAHLLSLEGATHAAVGARRHAWTTHPTRARLLALAGTGQDAGVVLETLAAEADMLDTAGPAGVVRLDCELLLLAGRINEAVAALAGSEPLGWHRADHPGPVVLPFLWAAVLGAAPAADAGHLGRLYADIDIDPAALPRFEGWPGWHGMPGVARDRLEPAGPPLTAWLADAIGRLSPERAVREEWLAVAGAVTDARIGAIVSGKHRGAYARAASLAYAHAETLAGLGRQSEARDYLCAVRARFPRHTAFRSEFDAAARVSSVNVGGR